MKKVELTMNAQEKYEIIKATVQNGNKCRAAVKLGCTVRHINRLINKYWQEGKAAFIHGNTGRQPAHTLSDDQRSSIIAIYANKYWDTNFTHCCELLEQHNGIKLSPSTLRKILYEEFILSPRATRRTKKHMTKLLKQLHSEIDKLPKEDIAEMIGYSSKRSVYDIREKAIRKFAVMMFGIKALQAL
jgi:transposase